MEQRKGGKVLKQLFKIELSKQEMLKFFENKIVEDEACKSNEGMATICLSVIVRQYKFRKIQKRNNRIII